MNSAEELQSKHLTSYLMVNKPRYRSKKPSHITLKPTFNIWPRWVHVPNPEQQILKHHCAEM